MIILALPEWENLLEKNLWQGRCKMIDLLASLAKLSFGFLAILGPMALVLLALQIRDQRESKLFAVVLVELNRPRLRGLFTVKVKSRPIGPVTIVVDLWNCSRERVWEVIETLSTALPSRVRLEVNGITDCRVRSTWKLTVMRTHPFASYCPI
jgi:hypothetical protein